MPSGGRRFKVTQLNLNFRIPSKFPVSGASRQRSATYRSGKRKGEPYDKRSLSVIYRSVVNLLNESSPFLVEARMEGQARHFDVEVIGGQRSGLFLFTTQAG